VSKQSMSTPETTPETTPENGPGHGAAGRAAEGGAVLLLMMLLIIGLLGLGVTGLWLTSGNLQVQANNNLRAQAMRVAEAGVARTRAALNAGVNIDALLAGQNAAVDNVPTALDAAGKPNGAGALFVDTAVPLSNIAFPPASFGRTGGTATAPLAATMGRYTVWIRNDTAECRLGQFTHDGNGTVLIRSRGVAADNLTAVVLEVALGATPAVPGTPGVAAGIPPVLCVSGKNGCDDNTSTVSGVVAN
jgi:Tfp pilus assembly protein PilX